ncbi:MAG: DUF6067 family protein [Candidatus Burarchaeum sp.]|nr:glycoside hydrolase domain-containing protein [Candidatus Burarchaeum sp.]MDO8339448.1 DUF6067 family protein [Candidatus Burarchaeum sp.]
MGSKKSSEAKSSGSSEKMSASVTMEEKIAIVTVCSVLIAFLFYIASTAAISSVSLPTSALLSKTDCSAGKCIELYALSSMVKLHNAAGPYADMASLKASSPSLLSSSASVKMAKNEGESFQIIINTNKADLQNVQVSVSDFTGPGGVKIPGSDNLKFFYEKFVQITSATDSLGGTGYYADALPLLNKPFPIAKGKNQPIWVKVNVPAGAPAGDYTGTITVKTSNAGSKSILVSVHVWNFALPDKPPMTAVFGLGKASIKTAYGLDEAQAEAKLDTYITYMLSNNVVPFGSGISHLAPTKSLAGSQVTVSFTAEQLAYLKKYISQYKANTWQFPIGTWMADESFVSGLEKFGPEFNARFKQYIEKTAAAYRAAGVWNDGNYFTWIIDEPNTLAQTQEVNKWSALVASASPHPKFMVTEQITKQNSAWPTLTNIDIWNPTVKVFATTEKANSALYTGKEFWWYNGGTGADFPSPEIIDREAASARIVPWYTKKFGASGYMYWSATYWGNAANNPFTNPKAFDLLAGASGGFANGEGYFFYPSTLISQYTPMQNVDGVTGSIRWENFLDGMEDYAYLSMASSSAQTSAFNLVLNPYPFSKSPATYEQARALLAADIA